MIGSTICLCGRIGSGKSTIAQELAQMKGVPVFSTGEYVKQIARCEGYKEFGRETLQKVGSILISKGWDQFCHGFLQYYQWSTGNACVIESIRDIGFYDEIKSIVTPLRTYLVFIDICEETRIQRILQRDGDCNLSYDNHETEAHYKELLRAADIVIRNDKSPRIVAREIIAQIV